MKNFLCLAHLMVCCFFLYGQNKAVEQGKTIIQQSMELYEKYYNDGKFKEAAQYANNASLEAEKLGDIKTQAEALSSQGKALMKVPNARNSVLNRAYKCFQESNYLTSDNTLKLSNLERMLILAKRTKRKKEIIKIKAEIALLKGGDIVVGAEEKLDNVFNRKKKAMEEYQAMRDERAELAESLSELSEEQELMRQQQSDLVNLIEQKESAIQEMTAEQIKQELIVSEQERLLDSMLFVNILDSFELAQTAMVMEQQEAELRERESEIQLKNSQRNLLLVLAGAVLIILMAFVHRYYSIRSHNSVLAEKNRIIEEEKKRSEELLLNILPAVIADELKSKGGAETQFYDEASVMFIDFKGFSRIAQQLSAEKLVAQLDHAFRSFDEIIDKYGLEKIKTIGDEYMCAGGVPAKSKQHPVKMVMAALEIQAFLNDWNSEKRKNKEPVFEARIGIHTGPLIAGVVGSKKFAYDIWGDTVNVASRLETKSEVGRINISAATYKRIKNEIDCEYRGKVPAKNVGEVEMYFVSETAG